jgi:hypothetical protein
MKILTIVFTALALCASAFAAPTETVTVQFSSPVVIGGKTLPAGEVRFNLHHGSNSVLLIAHAENGEAAAVVVNRIYEMGDGHTSVVLGRSGNTLKFERLWLDNGSGYAVADAQ